MKNKSLLLVVVGLAVVIGAIVLSNKQSQKATLTEVKPQPTFTVQETRKKNFGFKLNIDDCFTKDKKDYIVVDVDDEKTYVVASAKQYYSGPYPITETQLEKIDAKDLDSKDVVVKKQCSEMETKYTAK